MHRLLFGFGGGTGSATSTSPKSRERNSSNGDKDYKLKNKVSALEDAFNAEELKDDPIQTKSLNPSPGKKKKDFGPMFSQPSTQVQLSQVVSKKIVKDPHFEAITIKATACELQKQRTNRRIKKIEEQLNKPQIDLDKLKESVWSGIPNHVPHLRAEAWALLSDYIPVDQELRHDTLSRKHEEYNDLVKHYFGRVASCSDTVDQLNERIAEMSPYEVKNFKQIRIDVYRTQPEVKLFASQLLQTMMIRLLFIWSMRNPASAYVQGINDLAAPLLVVFLQGALKTQELVEEEILASLQNKLIEVEADVFWCLTKLVSDIQDNYTEMQPGVHKMLNKMKAIVEQIDGVALKHLESMDLVFMDFAYRWISCYLTREFNIQQIIRLWDTYFAEEEGFSQFHCYVCAVLFLKFAPQLMKMDYQEAMLFLQNVPTQQWNDDDLEMLVSKAFEMKQLYHYNKRLVNGNTIVTSNNLVDLKK